MTLQLIILSYPTPLRWGSGERGVKRGFWVGSHIILVSWFFHFFPILPDYTSTPILYFIENPDGGGFVSTLRRKKQTDTHKKITRNSTSPSHAKLDLQKSNHSRTSVSPTRNKIEPTINIMHQTKSRQQPQRQMSAIVNHSHRQSDVGHRISESSSSRTPSMPTTPTSPFPGSHTTSPWATPKYTQTYTYERQERLSAPRERFHSNSVPTRKISVQTDDGLLSDKNVIEVGQKLLMRVAKVPNKALLRFFHVFYFYQITL